MSRICLCLSLLLWLCVSSVFAQTDETYDVRVSSMKSQYGGTGMAAFDRWSLARATAINRSDQPLEAEIVFEVSGLKGIQVARQAWVPAQAERSVNLPLLVPAGKMNVKQRFMPLQGQAILLDSQSQTESPLNQAAEMSVLRARTSLPAVTFLGRNDVVHQFIQDVTAWDGGEFRPDFVDDTSAPIALVGYASTDVLVAVEPMALSPAQIETIQRWVMGGGRLWLPLDVVGEAYARQLLGGVMQSTVLDVSQTNVIRIAYQANTYEAESEAGYTWVRCLPGLRQQTLATMHQLPIAWRLSVGEGEVLVTALTPEAWLDANLSQKETAGSGLKAIFQRLFEFNRNTPKRDTSSALNHLAQAQVGYTIISRTYVFLALFGFVGALIVGFILLARMGRLEYSAALSCGVAVVMAVILYGIGVMHQGEVPLTIASAEMVSIEPQLNLSAGEGQAAFFSSDDVQREIKVDKGLRLYPAEDAKSDTSVRYKFLDIDRMVAEGYRLPRGAVVSHTYYANQQLNKQPVSATLQFTNGPAQISLQGITDDDVLANSHPLILFGFGAAVPQIQGNDLQLQENTYVTNDEYIGTDQLNDESTLRLAFYRNLLKSEASGVNGRLQPVGVNEDVINPQLLLWRNQSAEGIEIEGDPVRRGMQLVRLPVDVLAPEVGKEVQVPMALTRYRVVGKSEFETRFKEFDHRVVLNYDSMNHRFVGVVQPGVVAMEFYLPEAVLPFQVESLQLAANLDSPGRQTVIGLLVGDRFQQVGDVLDGSGQVTGELNIDAQDTIMIGQDQSLIVLVRVQNKPGLTGLSEEWKLSSPRLSITGRRLDGLPKQGD